MAVYRIAVKLTPSIMRLLQSCLLTTSMRMGGGHVMVLPSEFLQASGEEFAALIMRNFTTTNKA